MKMQRRAFRIGQLAKQLGVEKFVVRFWERVFQLRTERGHGGQRSYTSNDFETFQYIKELLYERRFTIAGAKQQLKSYKGTLSKSEPIIASQKTTLHGQIDDLKKEKEVLEQRVLILQQQLMKLRELL